MVCYDITDDSRRQQISQILEDHGQRVQWSVFECYLEQGQLEVLREQLLAEIDETEDSLRWYPVCVWCRERVICLGSVGPTDDPPFYMA